MTNKPLADSQSAVIVAENSFTASIQLDSGQVASLSAIRSSFTGTVVVQRKLPGQAGFQSVMNPDGTVGWTSKDVETSYYADERCEIRMGVATGGFAGTNVTCRVGKG